MGSKQSAVALWSARSSGILRRLNSLVRGPMKRVPATAPLALPPRHQGWRERSPSEGRADCTEDPNVHRALDSLTKSADGRVTTAKARLAVVKTDRERGMSCFPLPGQPCYGRLRPPSRLKMNSLALGLDGRLASQKSPNIQAKESIRYELTTRNNC
jgi:hypothetical protein